MLSETQFVKMFYKSWTQVLPSLGFERNQISFHWQGHRKMIRQLVRAERMSSYVDPRVARIPETVCTHGQHAATVDKNLVPRHSDL